MVIITITWLIAHTIITATAVIITIAPPLTGTITVTTGLRIITIAIQGVLRPTTTVEVTEVIVLITMEAQIIEADIADIPAIAVVVIRASVAVAIPASAAVVTLVLVVEAILQVADILLARTDKLLLGPQVLEYKPV